MIYQTIRQAKNDTDLKDGGTLWRFVTPEGTRRYKVVGKHQDTEKAFMPINYIERATVLESGFASLNLEQLAKWENI